MVSRPVGGQSRVMTMYISLRPMRAILEGGPFDGMEQGVAEGHNPITLTDPESQKHIRYWRQGETEIYKYVPEDGNQLQLF